MKPGRVQVKKQCPDPTRQKWRVGSGRVIQSILLPELEPPSGACGCIFDQITLPNPISQIPEALVVTRRSPGSQDPDSAEGCVGQLKNLKPTPSTGHWTALKRVGSQSTRTRPDTRRVAGHLRVNPTHFHPDLN
ncbi:hypothetical protein PGT21_035228 [Puccinia graminis f. sp. tritici]|uniref:Uncharacterized protein n=1 Tax=Puccinia graminis f. sp. tritici TaxID=56615 RepID=A0A5B0PK99_PUCGR|nr:hypothetical protein PGT21_035228 [Puccinia graminis f. sp. tritici]